MSSARVARMAKKVTIDNFDETIERMLAEYGVEVKENLDVITKKVTQQGVKALKSESAITFKTTSKHKKKYADTWTSRFQTGRISSQGTIYNTQPSLPHLLENGHVSRNGSGRTFGFVQGREHIRKVEQKLIDTFEREVIAKL